MNHTPSILNKKTSCAYCYSQGKNSQTFMYCKICKKGFCLNTKRLCWFKYHNEIESDFLFEDESSL